MVEEYIYQRFVMQILEFQVVHGCIVIVLFSYHVRAVRSLDVNDDFHIVQKCKRRHLDVSPPVTIFAELAHVFCQTRVRKSYLEHGWIVVYEIAKHLFQIFPLCLVVEREDRQCSEQTISVALDGLAFEHSLFRYSHWHAKELRFCSDI